MTVPFAVGGVGPAPSNAALELLGTSPGTGVGPGAASPAAVDPSLLPFAGVLARLVSLQATTDAGATRAPGAMVRDALASLEAALADAAPASDAGTAAIRALVEQVTRPGTATAPAPATAPAVTAASAVVDAATQSLGAAAMIAPPAAPVTVSPTPTRPRDVSSAGQSADDDGKAARTDSDAEGTASANARNDATNAGAAATVDPSVVVRDAAALDPAFRAKLDRVIARMQDEFGHKVTVVETVRSQVRQEALYEQGRTAPGQVVTWTRSSRHAEGMAVDLMIDGSYDNPVAYQRLQRIANEEGLHTLGARDPGHLAMRVPQAGGFLARTAVGRQEPLSLHAAAHPAIAALPTVAAPPMKNDAMARIARVAQVAQVAVTAGVANVAHVARVAVPGARGGNSAVSASTAPTGEPANAVKGADDASKSSARERSMDNGSGNAHRTQAAANEPLAAPFVPSARGAGSVAPVNAAVGPDQASRVGQIDALQEQVAALPVSSMVLNIDDGKGGSDRIRVDVRGAGVSSTIDVHDQQVASELSARTSELSRALESHGLASDGVRIRAVAQPVGTDALRQATGGEAAATRSLAGALGAEAATPSRRDRDEARDPRANWSQQQESHRERSRREREEQQP